MINEETIEQTRFYHRIDERDYVVIDVRSIKQVTIICCTDGSTERLLLGADECSRYAPVAAKFEAFNQVNEKKPPKPESKPVRGPYKKRGITSRKAAERIAGKAVKHIAGHHGPLKKVSQHKGVSLCKKRKNGTQKWRVQYYDPSTRRIKSLGAYYSEIEAAAVYQDHIGNEVEAARLRALDKQQTADMAEQKENNPDRVKADKMVMVWVCSRCRIEWKSKPDSCPNCNSASFKPKKVDADSI